MDNSKRPEPSVSRADTDDDNYRRDRARRLQNHQDEEWELYHESERDRSPSRLDDEGNPVVRNSDSSDSEVTDNYKNQTYRDLSRSKRRLKRCRVPSADAKPKRSILKKTRRSRSLSFSPKRSVSINEAKNDVKIIEKGRLVTQVSHKPDSAAAEKRFGAMRKEMEAKGLIVRVRQILDSEGSDDDEFDLPRTLEAAKRFNEKHSQPDKCLQNGADSDEPDNSQPGPSGISQFTQRPSPLAKKATSVRFASPDPEQKKATSVRFASPSEPVQKKATAVRFASASEPVHKQVFTTNLPIQREPRELAPKPQEKTDASHPLSGRQNPVKPGVSNASTQNAQALFHPPMLKAVTISTPPGTMDENKPTNKPEGKDDQNWVQSFSQSLSQKEQEDKKLAAALSTKPVAQTNPSQKCPQADAFKPVSVHIQVPTPSQQQQLPSQPSAVPDTGMKPQQPQQLQKPESPSPIPGPSGIAQNVQQQPSQFAAPVANTSIRAPTPQLPVLIPQQQQQPNTQQPGMIPSQQPAPVPMDSSATGDSFPLQQQQPVQTLNVPMIQQPNTQTAQNAQAPMEWEEFDQIPQQVPQQQTQVQPQPSSLQQQSIQSPPQQLPQMQDPQYLAQCYQKIMFEKDRAEQYFQQIQLDQHQKEQELKQTGKQFLQKAQELEAVHIQHVQKEQELQQIEKQILQRAQEIELIQNQHLQRAQNLQQIEQKVLQRTQEIEAIEKQLIQREQELQQKEKQQLQKAQELDAMKEQREKQLLQKTQELEAIQKQLDQKEEELQQTFLNKQQELQQMLNQVLEREQIPKKMQKQLIEKEQEQEKITKQLIQKEQEHEQKLQMLVQKEQEQQQALLKKEKELQQKDQQRQQEYEKKMKEYDAVFNQLQRQKQDFEQFQQNAQLGQSVAGLFPKKDREENEQQQALLQKEQELQQKEKQMEYEFAKRMGEFNAQFTYLQQQVEHQKQAFEQFQQNVQQAPNAAGPFTVYNFCSDANKPPKRKRVDDDEKMAVEQEQKTPTESMSGPFTVQDFCSDANKTSKRERTPAPIAQVRRDLLHAPRRQAHDLRAKIDRKRNTDDGETSVASKKQCVRKSPNSKPAP